MMPHILEVPVTSASSHYHTFAVPTVQALLSYIWTTLQVELNDSHLSLSSLMRTASRRRAFVADSRIRRRMASTPLDNLPGARHRTRRFKGPAKSSPMLAKQSCRKAALTARACAKRHVRRDSAQDMDLEPGAHMHL